MNIRRLSYTSVLVALAIIFGWIERMLPINITIQGIKLGLANIITLIAIYKLGIKNAAFIMIVRVFLSSLLFGTLPSFLYSLFGGALSLFVMSILYIIAGNSFSIIGISIAGGVFHNVGQILAAILLLKNISIVYYLPVLMVSGIITGFFIGVICKYIKKYLDRIDKDTNGKFMG